ncbi:MULTISPECIES: solute symporter family protein [Burkholderia]|uniref:solute symporter family protein n=1 Tax=Burkholderia TaxID=32008 RepID=UPI0003989CCD|nr:MULTISPECIES: cation acetate symporter [Burkholderia]ERJ37739.1 putative symporter YjcG [Burkholderia sp. AU4i]MBA9948850.1 cation acetate symporter [Burkholderia cepacia]MBA9979136.1 cation acetate symporter [Burkholderia cepacia]MBA9997820.1 cation acetate symporter [Burkholderia cepacia]MBB0005865.1 cation acetate symporter [Burkholderia cepacia]
MNANGTLTIVVFACLVLGMFFIIARAARRTSSTSDFLAAGRSISAAQNGLAIAGDFMSAGTFLGTTGLIYLYGFDGTLILVAAIFGFLPLLLIAERLRNAGAFTLSEVLSVRFNDPLLRGVTALTSLVVSLLYLVAQLVGAGILLQALTGFPYAVAVVITGVLMTIYVAFGGMLGASWVMIVKAIILLIVGFVMSVTILAASGWHLGTLMMDAAATHPGSPAFLKPGLLLPSSHPFDILSFGLVYMLGTAGLPHVLIRFFTVRDGNAARRSLGWAVTVMGIFFLMIVVLGLGARALLHGGDAAAAASVGGNLVAPILAGVLAGGDASVGGALAMAFISGVCFLTILAVVSGLLISASGTVAHDLFAGIIWRHLPDIERRERSMARVSSVAVGIVATLFSIAVGTGFNITFLLGLAFLVAASANLPALVCTLFWKRFSRTGAIVGLAGGLVVSVAVIVLSPTVMGKAALIPLKYPAIVSIPLGFALCWLGTMLGRDARAPEQFSKLLMHTEISVERDNVRTAHLAH